MNHGKWSRIWILGVICLSIGTILFGIWFFKVRSDESWVGAHIRVYCQEYYDANGHWPASLEGFDEALRASDSPNVLRISALRHPTLKVAEANRTSLSGNIEFRAFMGGSYNLGLTRIGYVGPNIPMFHLKPRSQDPPPGGLNDAKG